MPHYFFDLHDGDVSIDEEGRDCADFYAAMHNAKMEARHMAANEVRHGTLTIAHRIDILDASRKLLGSVSFGEAVAVC